MTGLQVSVDGLRNHIADPLARFPAFADKGGRYVEQRGFKDSYIGVLGELLVVVARSPVHVYRVVGEQELIIFPLVQGSQIISRNSRARWLHY